MADFIEIKTNANEVARKLRKAETQMRTRLPVLLNRLGRAARDDVRARIVSRADNTWAPLSKWQRAKGGRKPLVGTGAYVKSRVVGRQAQVYGEIPPSSEGKQWSLTQHHTGFQNKAEPGKLVIIRLKNPSALGLPRTRQTFSFIEKQGGKTPARQIWPTMGQLVKICQPMASKWLAETVKV